MLMNTIRICLSRIEHQRLAILFCFENISFPHDLNTFAAQRREASQSVTSLETFKRRTSGAVKVSWNGESIQNLQVQQQIVLMAGCRKYAFASRPARVRC